MAFFVEFNVVNPLTKVLETVRVSSARDFMSADWAEVPNVAYPSKLIDAGNFEYWLWGQRATRGISQVTFGSVKIDNSEGNFDYLLRGGFAGQSISIFSGDELTQFDQSEWVPLFSGTIMRADFAFQTLTIALSDSIGELADKELQSTKFAGTNSLPNGVEGLESDIKGQPKPKLRGLATNFAPPLVNTSGYVYQIDDGTALLPMAITGIYDKGASINVGTAQASLAALMATAPTAATYDYYAGSDGWFFKLGSKPDGTVTCTVSEGAASDRTVGNIVYRLITNEGGLSAAKVTKLAEMNAMCPGQVGTWEFAETTVGTVVDSLLNSVNGYLVETRKGEYQFGKLINPDTSASKATFEEWQILNESGFTLTASTDAGIGIRSGASGTGEHGYNVRFSSRTGMNAGLPVWRVMLDYDKNLTVQSEGDLAGAVTLARRSYLKSDYRTVIASDASVKDVHKRAPEFVCQSLLTSSADALVEAQNQLTLRSVTRFIIEITLDTTVASVVNIGDVFTVKASRFGFDEGKNFLLIGIVEQFGNPQTAANTTLIGWG